MNDLSRVLPYETIARAAIPLKHRNAETDRNDKLAKRSARFFEPSDAKQMERNRRRARLPGLNNGEFRSRGKSDENPPVQSEKLETKMLLFLARCSHKHPASVFRVCVAFEEDKKNNV